MPDMPPTLRASGQRSREERNREADQRRGSARKRGYTGKWDKAAKGHLDKNPLCAYCSMGEEVTPATLVDHLYPQRTYPGVFWVKVWWVSCCNDCHNHYKQRIERRGRMALDELARRLGLPTLDEVDVRKATSPLASVSLST